MAHYSVTFVSCENQIRKEAEKTAVTKVVVAADKAKEEELKARTREVIMTKQEQVHVTHEQVKMVFDMKLLLLLSVSTQICIRKGVVLWATCCFVSLGTRYQSLLESPNASLV